MISHHHGCIFVHIPKNAGQSIERVFLHDIGLTWRTRAPLLLRHNPIPELGPPRLAHLLAREYVELGYLPQEMFDRYFKFAVVRNPYSRAVSFYRYMQPGGRFSDWATCIASNEKWAWFLRPQADYVMLGDTNGMDAVLRFETLSDDFAQVRSRIGLKPDLGHSNASDIRQASKRGARNLDTHKDWRDYYDEAAQRAVETVYRADFEAFDYEFGL